MNSTESDLEKHTCISCGHEFTGNFCNNCGEKVIRTEDRKLKHFLGEFVNALTFADSKLWKTIKSMLVKPGQFSRDFVDGKRQAYMKPVSIFFLANLIYFLFPLFNTFNNSLKTQTQSESFIHSELASVMVQNKLTKRGITFQEYALQYNAKTTELSKLLLIVMALLLALFFAVIHFKKDLLLADQIVISLEVMTFVILFAIQLQGCITYILRTLDVYFKSEFLSESTISIVSLLLLLYFFLKMERNFYQAGKWRGLINSILCLVSFVIVLFAYRAFLFFVTFWSV